MGPTLCKVECPLKRSGSGSQWTLLATVPGEYMRLTLLEIPNFMLDNGRLSGPHELHIVPWC
jgi:hypothetical protein